MNINIATLCDKNYLAKGLAMRQSLIDLGVEFTLYWLCLDRETHFILEDILDHNDRIYLLSNLERDNSDLSVLRNNPETRYGSQRDNYIWSLAPYFVNYILDREIDPNDHLFYIDSDIYFYQSPQVILDVMGNKSIAIHTHRFGPNRKKLDVGWYNVGVIGFKNDRVGKLVSNLWKHWVIDTSNPYYNEYGTCGDQKYLELFVEMFPKQVCVFDEEGSISHLAPWCCELEDKPVVFFHFSHFQYDLKKNEWRDSIRGEWKPSRHAHIKPYYESYFEVIKNVSKLIP